MRGHFSSTRILKRQLFLLKKKLIEGMSRLTSTIALFAVFVFGIGCASEGATMSEKDEHASSKSKKEFGASKQMGANQQQSDSTVSAVIFGQPEEGESFDSLNTFPRMEETVRRANRLERSLDQFEKQIEETQSTLRPTMKASKGLKDTASTTEVQSAAIKWKKGWDKAETQISKLEAHVDELGYKAAAYFNHLDRQTARIENEEIRNEEKLKNEKMRSAWRASMGEATQDLRLLQKNAQEGKDLYTTMLNASARGAFSGNVDRLADLTKSNSAVLVGLNDLVKTGNKILGGPQEKAIVNHLYKPRSGVAESSSSTQSSASKEIISEPQKK